MSNIFSNRFFQGIVAAVIIIFAIFTYQSYTSADIQMTTVESTNDNSITTTATTAELQVEAHQVYVPEDNMTENAVNNTTGSDNINTAND